METTESLQVQAFLIGKFSQNSTFLNNFTGRSMSRRLHTVVEASWIPLQA